MRFAASPDEEGRDPRRAMVDEVLALEAGSDTVHSRLLRQRIIMLDRTIDDNVASRVAAEMLLLAGEDHHTDISLFINSPGGSITAGMAIYDTMGFVKCDVATYAMGMTALMGLFLLSGGAKGKRYAMPHAHVAMRQPSAGIGGTISDVAVQAELFRKYKWEMAELIAYHTGQSLDQVMVDFDRDKWFSAQEALAYGFIDHVLSATPERKPQWPH